MQHRDIPIITKDDDKLNFSDFASKIAQGILNYKQSETLIFSIEGEWGSGKTSLINLIKNELKNDVEILHFNPWLLTDITQVIKLFFDELIKVLSYGSFNVKFNEDIKKDLIKFASLILPESLTIDVKFIKLDYKPKNLLPSIKDENIEKLKSKINEYLRNLDKKIVVVVDDIDRLTDNETEFIFRLTKGIADFDNLIYILLYDKGVVGKSLEKFKSENGQKYLEKIVQYSLSVPKPHTSTIKNLLFEQLDGILADLEVKKKRYIFQQDRWSYVHPILSKYIRTIRDVSQIINIMSFEYPIICEDVNFTDFFIISLIKLKNYELYEHIKNKPQDFFINPNDLIFDTKKEEERIEKNFTENIKQFHTHSDLLEIIFPLLGEKPYYHHNKSVHKTKGIDNPYYHESYFAFAVSNDKISMKDYYHLENSLLNHHYEEFALKIFEIDKKNKVAIFLDMFEEIGLNNLKDNQKIENSFINLIKISTKLESKDNKGFLTSTPILWRCERIAFEILIQHSQLEEYAKQIIINGNQIELRVKVNLYENLRKENNNGKYKLSDETMDLIRFKIRQDLENITLDMLIFDNELSYLILRFDLAGASLEKLSHEIGEYIFNTEDNFFKILKIFQRTSMVSSSNRGTYERHSICKESLEKLIELNKVNDFIKKLDKTTLDDEKNKLLQFWEKGDRLY